jgi:Protein of unknown function (DUF2568)
LAGGGKTTTVGQGTVLMVRFACELAAIAAVAVWGFGVSWVLGVVAPAAVVLVWGLFLAPKRRFELGRVGRLALELGVWTAATAALVAIGAVVLAVVFAVVAVVTGALNHAWAG